MKKDYEIEVTPASEEWNGINRPFKVIRVAAYCRVSTEEEAQQGSFEVQKAYYTEKISNHEGWVLAGIFADDGISGTSINKRDGFKAMLQKCKRQQIDLILTKSISRFARNTIDSVQTVRLLKSLGVTVIFEKEGINTSDMSSEMILTVLSAFAQAESESMSLNISRGKRMGYKQGRVPFNCSRFLGYRKGPDGEPEIDPEQAETVRLIFNRYLNGDSLTGIAHLLESRGIKTVSGKSKWVPGTIQSILTNEKYCGDVIAQKTFVENVLTHKVQKNTGQLPKYRIKNHHDAIISRELFQEVQAEIAKRQSRTAVSNKKTISKGRYNSKYALSDRMVCGKCGSFYKRTTWDIHGRKKIVWRCSCRLEYGLRICPDSPTIDETTLHSAIVRGFNMMAEGYQDTAAQNLNEVLAECIESQQSSEHSDLEVQIADAKQEFDSILDRILTSAEPSDFLEARLKLAGEKLKKLQEEKKEMESQIRPRAKSTITVAPKEMKADEYSEDIVKRTVVRITVLNSERIQICFKDGKEINATL